MRILAIDPGNTESAYVVWDGKEIICFAKESNAIIKDLLSNKWAYASTYDLCAIEMVASYGMPVGATVFETCVWIGRFYEHAHDVSLVYRKDVGYPVLLYIALQEPKILAFRLISVYLLDLVCYVY